MAVAGVDTHKNTLQLGVIDALGKPLHVLMIPNTVSGFTTLVSQLRKHEAHRVGIEGSGSYGRALAVHLATLDEFDVVEVPPGLTSRERFSRPAQGKTDTVDAIAIARIAAREDALPPIRLIIGVAADLRALLDYRDHLIHERTANSNRVHAELSGLRPGYHRQIRHLQGPTQTRTAKALIAGDETVRAQLALRRLLRIEAIDLELKDLRSQISALVKASDTSLTDIYGIGVFVAARLLAEIVDIRRYPNRDAFASANGSSPLAASSGRTVRHRLNRTGNRQMNRCLYTIAITEIRADTEGRAYYARKRAQGKTSREAVRCLKRRLSDVIYRTMTADLQRQQAARTATAA